MIEQFDEAMSVMKARYHNILSNYYPAHGSTGFTERNLTNNLVSALESVLGDRCISWFEAPISIDKNNKKHLDAVVFFEDVTILIEAKRFTNVGPKLKSVDEDIERMSSLKSITLLEEELKLKNSDRRRYAIVLTDLWTATPIKRETYETWPKNLPVNFSDSIIFSRKLSFSDLPVDGEWRHHYKILVAIAEIKI